MEHRLVTGEVPIRHSVWVLQWWETPLIAKTAGAG